MLTHTFEKLRDIQQEALKECCALCAIVLDLRQRESRGCAPVQDEQQQQRRKAGKACRRITQHASYKSPPIFFGLDIQTTEIETKKHKLKAFLITWFSLTYKD